MKVRLLRGLLAGISILAVACAASAQQSTRTPKIGVITLGVPASSPHIQAFRQGLREQGYAEGKNILVEYRYANGSADLIPGMIAELLRLRVDILVTESAAASLAASKATRTVPVVQAVGADPVETGLAASLARPGGNVTGLSLGGAERTAKQLQLLKESMPAVSTVAVIYNPERPGMDDEFKQADQMARSLGLTLQFIEVRSRQNLDAAFEKLLRAKPTALVTIGHGMLLGNSKRIAEFALTNRLPAVFPEREFAEAGGMMAYGPDIAANFRRAAGYVDRILKGAKPGDLPIEQPTKWGLVINLRTAQALGIKIPGSVLVRADEVIQ